MIELNSLTLALSNVQGTNESDFKWDSTLNTTGCIMVIQGHTTPLLLCAWLFTVSACGPQSHKVSDNHLQSEKTTAASCYSTWLMTLCVRALSRACMFIIYPEIIVCLCSSTWAGWLSTSNLYPTVTTALVDTHGHSHANTAASIQLTGCSRNTRLIRTSDCKYIDDTFRVMKLS